MNIGKWQIFLYDKAGTFLTELPADTLNVTKQINEIWTAQVSVDFALFSAKMVAQGTTADAVLSAGLRTVDIQRDGVSVFKGILNEANINYSDTSVTLDLAFKSWLAYFEKRFTSEVYTSEDAGEIAWDIINHAQLETDGSIGITKGTVTVTKDRDRTFDRDEIAEQIIKMSADNVKDGFDFEITNDKVFSVSARLGADKPAIVFDNISILSSNIIYQLGLNIVTQSHQLGNGSGTDQVQSTKTASATYTGKWYLQEKYTSNTSISEQSTLDDHAQKEIDDNQDSYKYLKLSVNTQINPSTYDVGDGVTVELLGIISGLYRIKTKSYQISQGSEVINLEFY